MESPQTSKSKVSGAGDSSLSRVNCTPRNCRSSSVVEEFGLYNLYRESSPNFRAGQDVLEVGWGDSPEPLKVEQKCQLSRTPVACKKKLETKESPKSSIPFKKRNIRSTFNIPSKSIIDVAKYVAEVQELSKNIMQELKGQKIDKDLFDDVKLIPSDQVIEGNLKSRLSSVCKTLTEIPNKVKDDRCKNSNNDSNNDSNSNSSSSGNNQTKDPIFDNVLQRFKNEEDDWLLWALVSQEQVKTSHKGNFVKSKSENELTLPQSVNLENQCLTHNCRNISNTFRRTSSFNMTKPQSDTNNEKNINSNVSSNQCSFQEIEKKRLEAKYRKERREIEKKKLEALKKLEMKKLRVLKT